MNAEQVALIRRAVAMGDEVSLMISRAEMLDKPDMKKRALDLMEDVAAIFLTVGADLAEVDR